MGRKRGSGQSNGCRTCKKRKIMCDATRPSCLRCMKGDLKCEGYGKDHRFVDEVGRIVKRLARKENNNNVSYSVCESTLTKILVEPILPADGDQLGRLEVLVRPISRPMSRTGDLTENEWIPYTLTNLFNGIPISEAWLLSFTSDPSPSSQSAIRAISSIYFGQRNHHKVASKKGFRYYGMALQSLNLELQNRKRAGSLSVLRGVLVLFLFEVISFCSPLGWSSHTQGLSQLIQLHTPHFFQDPEARILLEIIRPIIIQLHLFIRKQCFLSKSAWKIIPWEGKGETGRKSLLLELHEIMSGVPELMEDLDGIERRCPSGYERERRTRKLEGKLGDYFGMLKRWRIFWGDRNPGGFWEVVYEDGLFQTVLYFSNLKIAGEYTLYNTILLLLLQLSSKLEEISTSADIGGFMHPTMDLKGVGKKRDLEVAREICRCVDYHFLEGQDTAGAFLLLFPLRVAMLSFREKTEEKVWLENVIGELMKRKGFEIGLGLKNGK